MSVNKDKYRCEWVNENNELYVQYHDEQWGVPEHSDDMLFEMLILEGAQAGLSWEIVLKKRENYKKAFDNFNPKKVAKYNKEKQEELMQNEGIIRNRLKIQSAIRNAKIFLKIQKEFGSFNNYIWSFVNYKPIINNPKSLNDIPTQSPLSEQISKDLKSRGMNFIGPTIIYAYMQAIGVVDDHEARCFKNKSKM